MKFTVAPPMRGGRVYGHDDEPVDDDVAPAKCPACGEYGRVFRRALFDGLVCVSCAERLRHLVLEEDA